MTVATESAAPGRPASDRPPTPAELRHELQSIADQLEQEQARRDAAGERRRHSKGKLARDCVAAAAGLALADLSSHTSLLVSFWASTSLMIDTLDLAREGRADRATERAIESLLRRQEAIGQLLARMEQSRHEPE